MILDCTRCGTKHVQTTREFALPEKTGQSRFWYGQRCQNGECQGLLLVVTEAQNGRTVQVFPGGEYELSNEVEIGGGIRDDYREAGKCLDAQCLKASLVMSRRALQRILSEQGCRARNLGGEDGAIAEAVKLGKLRAPLHELAEEIKAYGNLGAHPSDEELEGATVDGAAQVLAFLRLLIEEFYEIPARARALRARRQ